MTMQRRHFELIAETLREELQSVSVGSVPHNAYIEMSKAFAAKLRATNPNFNRERFLRACGVE